MAEPDYLAQTGEVDITSPDACREWFDARAKVSKERGISALARMSINKEHGLLLFEGWKVSPDDLGEPRWQFTARQRDPGSPVESLSPAQR